MGNVAPRQLGALSVVCCLVADGRVWGTLCVHRFQDVAAADLELCRESPQGRGI
ncbi:hypothetical protein Micbo1qcDRAFT_166464, partial [Microdochium bolleyi]